MKFLPGELAFQVTACHWISLFLKKRHGIQKTFFRAVTPNLEENQKGSLKRQKGELGVKTRKPRRASNVKQIEGKALTSAHVILFCFLNLFDPVDYFPTPSFSTFLSRGRENSIGSEPNGTPKRS